MQELEKMLDNVCTILNVDKQEVISKNRKEDLVRARAIFSYIARERKATFYAIADVLDRDHSSVIHLVKLAKNMDNYIKLKNDFEKVVYGRSIC
jgi:chromosomal replication initiation ATPase DnaA